MKIYEIKKKSCLWQIYLAKHYMDNLMLVQCISCIMYAPLKLKNSFLLLRVKCIIFCKCANFQEIVYMYKLIVFIILS